MDNAVVDTSHADRIKAELLKLAKQIAPASSNKISTNGKVFKLPDGQSSPGPMNVVVLDFTAEYAFFEGAYNPQVKAAPVCFAVNQDLSALTPSVKSPKPQAANCRDCPKNQWKSGNGGKGKACKNSYRLIVLPMGFTDKTNAMTLYVSPSGLKHWDAYVRRLAVQHTARPIDVITKISFDPNQAYPTLLFDFLAINDNVLVAEEVRALSSDMLTREPEGLAKAA